jgi:hypothetical protein
MATRLLTSQFGHITRNAPQWLTASECGKGLAEEQDDKDAGR